MGVQEAKEISVLVIILRLISICPIIVVDSTGCNVPQFLHRQYYRDLPETSPKLDQIDPTIEKLVMQATH